MPRNRLIRIRRGTASQWSLINPILASGEPGQETDTNKLKIGDGVTAWNSLSYIGSGVGAAAGITGQVQFNSSGAFAASSDFHWDNGTSFLGLGNAAPSQRLHVTGNLRVTGAYYDSSNSAGSSGQVLASTGTGTDWVSLSEITGVDGSGTLNYLPKWTPDGNSIGDSLLFDDGTNVGIAATTMSARLHVKGTGDTSATNALNLENSAGTHIFRVRNDGGIHVGPTTGTSNGAFISPSDGTDNIGATTSSGLRYRSSLTLSGTGSDHYFRNYQGSRSSTSGTSNLIETVGAFAPTSGTGVYNLFNGQVTVNQTGGANGITRGLLITPTLTAAADFRAIETSNGPWRLTDTYASGSGSLAGPAFIINQTWNTSGTPTAFQVNITDTASNASSLAADFKVGGTSIANLTKAGMLTVTDRIAFSNVAGQPRLRRIGTILDVVTNDESAYATLRLGELRFATDTIIVREAAYILAQRNGVNAQTLRVYNTYTDASNYERAKISWESNILRIGTEKAGTGSARAFELQTDGTTRLTIAANGTITTQNGVYVGSTSNFIINASANGAAVESVFGTTQPYAPTSGSRTIFNAANSFAPTSGTATYIGASLSPTVNQTGGANGITRGLYVSPTLTAASDWRSVETSNNSGWAFYAAGTALSYFNGNVGIKTSPGSELDVKGTLRLSGSSSGYVGFAPASAAGSTTYTLPSADGISGQVLSTNGSATLSWATVSGSVSDGDKGDITVSSSGTVWTIDNGVVTNAKLADVATATFKGRTTAGTGAPEDLTATQATALLNVFTSGLKGLTPASGGGTSNFLRADGTWTAPTFSAPAPVIYSPTSTTSVTETSGEVVVLADATSGNLTVNLPTAVANTAKITIKKIDSSSNTVIIDGSTTETIDGSLTKTIEFQYTSVSLIGNGSNWFII